MSALIRHLLGWALAGALVFPALIAAISLATGQHKPAVIFVVMAAYGAAFAPFARLMLP